MPLISRRRHLSRLLARS